MCTHQSFVEAYVFNITSVHSKVYLWRKELALTVSVSFYFRKHENGNETSIEMEILWIKAPAFNIYI